MVSDFIRDLTLHFVCAGARAPSFSGDCFFLWGLPRMARDYPALTRLEQMWRACAPRRAGVPRAQTYRTDKRPLHRGSMRILSCVRRSRSTTRRCVTLINWRCFARVWYGLFDVTLSQVQVQLAVQDDVTYFAHLQARFWRPSSPWFTTRDSAGPLDQ